MRKRDGEKQVLGVKVAGLEMPMKSLADAVVVYHPVQTESKARSRLSK